MKAPRDILQKGGQGSFIPPPQISLKFNKGKSLLTLSGEPSGGGLAHRMAGWKTAKIQNSGL
jgi:hypothetical protein